MKHWLMKAEPDSRIVKGKDVKFSVDDFEAMKTTPWEGVRNAEARNLMKEMQVGDRVLFYHSNCKNPGIAAFAEVSKEAYPDYTAWDPSHPYYDQKTDKENPKWYMVDLVFKARAKYFVPLSLLKRIAASSSSPPAEVDYIGQDGLGAIKEMALINRGRLSVQRVEEKTWSVIEKLADTGGWEDDVAKKGRIAGSFTKTPQKKTQPSAQSESQVKDVDGGVAAIVNIGNSQAEGEVRGQPTGKKRKAGHDSAPETVPLRRSTRTRR